VTRCRGGRRGCKKAGCRLEMPFLTPPPDGDRSVFIKS
jgi:hypothetical protein